jgi:ADP-heptose:LPS heptosyltransferase
MYPAIKRTLLNLAYGKPHAAEGSFDLSKVKKILLIRRNGYGDMICALPLIRNIRAALPNVQLDILASERNACIVEHLDLVDRVHLYTRGQGMMRNHYLNLKNILKPIQDENYDLLIAIKGGFSPLLAVISYAGGA